MAYLFKLPGRAIFGENALEQSEPYLKTYGKKALIVTGKIVSASEPFRALTDSLTNWDLDYTVFSEITGEPTDQMIEAGVTAYRAAGCDFLIGIGGGSPLDSAKAIGAMSVLGGSIADYLGVEMTGDFPPLVLIPTTAGTGSETTKFTVVTDTENNVKMLLKGDALLPDLAIVDACFSGSAPAGITAATGMDALTHAVESYTSRKANPMTDLYAIDAIQRIFAYLPAAYVDGGNREAREALAVAAFEAGACINNASVTLVHGMSRPIGALFHVPHGISNAMLITKCLSYAADGCYEKFAAMAKAIGVADDACDKRAAAEAFLTALRQLCTVLEIPTLAQYGIQKADFDAVCDKMATDAMASGSPANTIKSITKADLLALYKALW